VRPELATRVQEIAEGARLLGPHTAPDIIAEHRRRLQQEQSLVEESRAKFEAGEILEEELYGGDGYTLHGNYPLLMEVNVAGRVCASYLSVPVRALEEEPTLLESRFIPEVREMLKEKVAEFLTSRTAQKADAAT